MEKHGSYVAYRWRWLSWRLYNAKMVEGGAGHCMEKWKCPHEWKEAIIIPVCMKGCRLECGKWQGINIQYMVQSTYLDL